jgi:transposase-like protein
MAEPSCDNSTLPRATIDDTLPPIDTQRWSPQRKALVIAAVRTGALSFEEACNRYQLSAEELIAWRRAIEMHGIGGLRVTRLQAYPRPDIRCTR